MMNQTGKPISTGVLVHITGSKTIYAGKLRHPKTWFKFERVNIVEPVRCDHSAVIGVVQNVNNDTTVVIKLL